MLKLTGDPEQADEVLSRAEPLVSEQSVYNQACYAAVREDIESALPLLEQALANGEPSLEWVRKDPDFMLIRDDVRFQALLARFEREA